MDERYTLTVYVAAPGTPLEKGGTSLTGHMFYVVSDGEDARSFGFAPVKDGSPRGPGHVVDSDAKNYLNPRYARTMEVTKEQYEKLLEFGTSPNKHGFDTYYNGVDNSCIDFTWGALNHAGLHRRILGFEHETFDGQVKVLPNISEVRSIKDPVPGSDLNKERVKPLPERTPAQLLFSEHQQETPNQRFWGASGQDAPRHPLHEQADKLVRQMDRDMGRQSDVHSERMAASAARLAKESGFDRIDHVLLSNATASKGAGETVFVVQGDAADPAHLRAQMPTQKAVDTPVEQSVQELARLETNTQQQAMVREQTETVAREQAAQAHRMG